MSLHFIGIRDFPVLHRQFSSPTTKVTQLPSSSHSPSQSIVLARDSKDVLIQRLNDLSYRLMITENLEDDEVTALHTDVDHMERMIPNRISTSRGEESSIPEEGRTIDTPKRYEDDSFWGPMSPERRRRGMEFSEPPTRISKHRQNLERTYEMSPKQAARIANEAEELKQALTVTIEELIARKEETNHIHTLLVNRAEIAAQRIIVLEKRVKEFKVDFEENESELSFLRLQLRALEIQGMEYILPDEDLSESIKNWKLDWADVDQRTKARRRKCRKALEDSDFDDSQTIVDAV